MKKNRILITAYSNPDLDGVACSVAYAEFLQKNGKNAIAGLFGSPHREAQFVFKTFNIPPPKNAEKMLPEISSIILVDASDVRGLSDKITPSRVIELIDHRKVNQADSFPNAKIEIEFVGAAATLIAEKFVNKQTNISSSSAALLYSAIISNTINFQASVTTSRDIKAAKWLQTKFSMPSNYIRDMFAFKSQITEPLIDVINHDFAEFSLGEVHVGIGQLEIINTSNFVRSKLTKIKAVLRKIKSNKALDIIFLSVIDVEKATNTFIIIDKQSEELLAATLNLSFKIGIAKSNAIMMRKTIVPLLKKTLS